MVAFGRSWEPLEELNSVAKGACEGEGGRERNRKWGIREGDTKENAPAFTPMILWLKAYSCEANGKNQSPTTFLPANGLITEGTSTKSITE